MSFPAKRLRRLRIHPTLRTMVREHHLDIADFIAPLFVVDGKNIKREIPSMPGQFHFSLDQLSAEIKEIHSLGIPSVLLFGVPSAKDEMASAAYAQNGIVQQAVQEIKRIAPDLIIITDVCLCAYTGHGHCGVVKNGKVENDTTLELLAKTAVSHAAAGADMAAPSDMMDGRVRYLRSALDKAGFQDIGIMAYSAKYASAFYGPFREAAESAPQFGDRKSYQMEPANVREAIREIQSDIEEGADIVMVKPALAYLDVLRVARDQFPVPLAAYNVSGEYAMVKAAAQKGWIDESKVTLEILTGFKRAGADLIISYHAKEAAKWLNKKEPALR